MKKVYVVFYRNKFVGIWGKMLPLCRDLKEKYDDAFSFSWLSKRSPKEIPATIKKDAWMIKVENVR